MFDSTMFTLANGVTGTTLVGLALLCIGLGLVRMESVWMVFAALLAFPYAYSVSSWSGVLLLVRLLPLTQLVAAYFIDQEERLAAWLFCVPTLLMLLYAFYHILFSQDAFRILLNSL